MFIILSFYVYGFCSVLCERKVCAKRHLGYRVGARARARVRRIMAACHL